MDDDATDPAGFSPEPQLPTAELVKLLEAPGSLAQWLATHGNDGALLLAHHCIHAHLKARAFLGPQPPGKGAIRIEAWNEWPEAQRDAYRALRDFAGLEEM